MSAVVAEAPCRAEASRAGGSRFSGGTQRSRNEAGRLVHDWFALALVFLLLAFATALPAAEPPLSAVERAKLLADVNARLVALDAALAQSPGESALLSRRGDCRLFLARFADAIADFEKMIALDPAQDAPHWRLGIAYFFAGRFAESSRQFAKYHAYDDGDRENGLWKFLGDAHLHGLARARREMLPYTRFDREPFPALYTMFAAGTPTRDFFADLAARKLSAEPRVMFFADYYAGLHEELLGQRDAALEFLRRAVANRWGQTAEQGPAYMWQVARLHYERLASGAATATVRP